MADDPRPGHCRRLGGPRSSGWSSPHRPGAETETTETTETLVLRLAVYMPDGSAPLVQTVWIRDDHGRSGRIEVNPWTGLPSFERVTSARADDGDLPRAEDPENQR